jgi:nucleotide-binding universal stress UspA family protein
MASTEKQSFHKLLVPLDGTSQAAVALPLARTVATATGAEIVLLRVVPEGMLGPDEPASEGARKNLAAIAAELGRAHLTVHPLVQAGVSPAEEILWAAEREHADLIVMATRGQMGIRRAVLGSVAERVVAESPIPVLLLRPGGHRVTHLTTLLVPVDGSPGAALALGLAVPLAQATGARLVLVDMVPSVVEAATRRATAFTPLIVDPAWDEEALASARSYVEGLVARLRQAGVEATGRALMGQAAEGIVEVGNEVGADLIVMSTHGLTGPARTILGSVADAVVRTAHRPVLLLRRGAGEAR